MVITARVADNEPEIHLRTRASEADKTFTPKTEELNTGDYKVKLQEGLTINLERPHIAIFKEDWFEKTTAPGNPVADSRSQTLGSAL